MPFPRVRRAVAAVPPVARPSPGARRASTVPSGPPTSRAAAAAAVGAVLLVVGTALVAWPRPAAAEVVHGLGWSGTVAGWSSWYGSYGMGELGTAWCIDHGSAAPDAAFGYVPADLSGVPADTRAAMAWALGSTGAEPDQVGAAALMLVLHDLMGAVYPAGELDVDRLDPSTMSGFDGNEADVVARARAVKADALAHAGVRPPLAIEASATAVAPGQDGHLTVAVTDADGDGVAGVLVRARATGATIAGEAEATTGDDGRAVFAFTAGDGDNRFSVDGLAPDPVLAAYGSSTTPAQRVAVPRVVRLSATARFGPPPSTITVHKTGDATAYLPVAGARFEVRPAGGGEPLGTLVTGDDGTTEVLPVPPGRYEVHEVQPPPGYEVAGPWRVEVPSGEDVVVEVADHATQGLARIAKVDALTGRTVPGATLALHYDADRDGTYETALDPVVTGERPADVRLRPGDYRLTEVTAPDGYQPLDRPLRFSVSPGERVAVTVENRPVETPPTTTPPTTTPTTTTPPTTTPPTAPPPTPLPTTPPPTAPPTTSLRPVPPGVPSPRPPETPLPATGPASRTAGLASVGGGLLFLGAAAVGAVPGRPGRRPEPPDCRPGGSGFTPPVRPAWPAASPPRSPAAPAGPRAGRWRRRS